MITLTKAFEFPLQREKAPSLKLPTRGSDGLNHVLEDYKRSFFYSVSNMLKLLVSPAGAVQAAHGRQAPQRAPGAPLLQDQQRLLPVRRRRRGRQPLGPEQRLLLERGTRPPQHGHLHGSHDSGENHACARHASLNAVSVCERERSDEAGDR